MDKVYEVRGKAEQVRHGRSYYFCYFEAASASISSSLNNPSSSSATELCYKVGDSVSLLSDENQIKTAQIKNIFTERLDQTQPLLDLFIYQVSRECCGRSNEQTKEAMFSFETINRVAPCKVTNKLEIFFCDDKLYDDVVITRVPYDFVCRSIACRDPYTSGYTLLKFEDMEEGPQKSFIVRRIDTARIAFAGAAESLTTVASNSKPSDAVDIIDKSNDQIVCQVEEKPTKLVDVRALEQVFEKEEPDVCDICKKVEFESVPSDKLLSCQGCGIKAHSICSFLPEGSDPDAWKCLACQLGRAANQIPCILCPRRGGLYCQSSSNETAHILCATWYPKTCLSATTGAMIFLEGYEKDRASRRNLICQICQDSAGACIQCAKGRCLASFHITCAQRNGYEFREEEYTHTDNSIYTKFEIFCEAHSRFKNVTKEKKEKQSKPDHVTKSNSKQTKMSEVKFNTPPARKRRRKDEATLPESTKIVSNLSHEVSVKWKRGELGGVHKELDKIFSLVYPSTSSVLRSCEHYPFHDTTGNESDEEIDLSSESFVGSDEKSLLKEVDLMLFSEEELAVDNLIKVTGYAGVPTKRRSRDVFLVGTTVIGFFVVVNSTIYALSV